MTAFWKNLHGLARGQLLNGGYLAPEAAVAAAARDRDDAAQGGKRTADKDCRRRVPWPRLAAYR